MFNQIGNQSDFSQISKHSSILWNDDKSYDTLLSELNAFIDLTSRNSIQNNKKNNDLTKEMVQEKSLLIANDSDTFGTNNNACSQDVPNSTYVDEQNFVEECLNDNSDKLSSIEENIILNMYLKRLEKRITFIPPLYRLLNSLAFTMCDFNAVKMEYIDIFCKKKPLVMPELSSLVNKKLNMVMDETIVPHKKSVWEDEVIKRVIQNRDIDVVINLDSFVKLILASLKHVDEVCYLPFLKIKVERGDQCCMIFDKVINHKPNINKERNKNIKRRFSTLHSTYTNKKSKLEMRITKHNGGIVDSESNCSLNDFVNGVNDLSQERLADALSENDNDIFIKTEDTFPITISDRIKKEELLQVDSSSIASENLVIDDEVDARSHVVEIVTESLLSTDMDRSGLDANNVSDDPLEANRHSYGLWKIKDTRVMFRYKYPVKLFTDDASVDNAESIYYHVTTKRSSIDEGQVEDSWKTLIGSMLCLRANILRIATGGRAMRIVESWQ